MIKKMHSNKIELLAPCGGMEQLHAAIDYGADAVYIGSAFSLRAHADNFTGENLKTAVDYVKSKGKRIYVAMNSIIKPDQIDEAREKVREIANSGADAIIIADPGMLEIIKDINSRIEIHLSTQVSTINPLAAAFWQRQGISRVVLAREATLEDIKEIHLQNPSLELECFVHGAMCIAYSGRCLLSSYFNGRSANCGDCTQTCRWQFDITEVKRPNDTLRVEQVGDATYILSSKDLNMISHLDKLMEAGVYSFKIEGRMKTAFYVATVVRAYRMAIDAILEGKPVSEDIVSETFNTSHREYSTGFYYGNPLEDGQQYGSKAYVRDYEFTGVVLKSEPGRILIEQRSKFNVGDNLEILSPGADIIHFTVNKMYDTEGNEVESAPHPQQHLYIEVDFKTQENVFIRKKK